MLSPFDEKNSDFYVSMPERGNLLDKTQVFQQKVWFIIKGKKIKQGSLQPR